MRDSIRLLGTAAAALILLAAPGSARAEDGYRLWLRYDPLPASIAAHERESVAGAAAYGSDPRVQVAAREFNRAAAGLLHIVPTSRIEHHAGKVMLGTAADLRKAGVPTLDLSALGPEGYLVRSLRLPTGRTIVVTGNSGAGVLYGTFALIRELQLGHPLDDLNLRSSPAYPLRMLDHWDNLDGTVERGYAGKSLWNWAALPGRIDPRYIDYARANASIGINGVVLNNVNADPKILTGDYLKKVVAPADTLRPYGIRVFLSVRFSSPMEIGGLKTADPLDPAVRAWWREKSNEIYRLIPDFGGFLVKANSEGQPGPQDYHRTHADGANMLAEPLAAHGGIVMWRAFVYSSENTEDRAKQAYTEFVPLDGKFADNVLVQVKNGPIDFQPREPFSPLFGAMPKTPLMMEVQITKEYLGFATHLVYLGALYEEVLRADTQVRGKGSTVARIIDGELDGHVLSGMAGVANIGSDRNWSGSHFDQANWYAFGRLAWDPELSARTIAEEWVRMTFSNDPAFVGPVVAMMMGSREAAVNYMTPLGLAHLMGTGHHYGPAPWVSDLKRPEWNPAYYHRADASGIGVERGPKGTQATAQYSPPIAAIYADPNKTPENLLLWFHHVPWDRKMSSGRTLWDELVYHYDRGVEAVKQMRRTWDAQRERVDAERFAQVAAFLAIQ